MKPEIAPFGDRVVSLRLVEERDLQTILDWRNRDDARIWFKTSAKLSFESHNGWYQRYREKPDDLFFLIEADRRPVGQCAIYDIDEEGGTAEIGRFLVAPDMGKKGYITRACTELMSFGHRVLRIPYLFLEVLEHNERAIQVYVRCGFTEESRGKGLVRMSHTQSNPP
jgi:diamine N-acetyltransferase